MNLNNIFKKVSGVALAAILSFGTFTVDAYAAEAPTLTKNVGNENQYFGGGTFTFAIEDGTIGNDEFEGFNKPANGKNLVKLTNGGQIKIPAGSNTGTLPLELAKDLTDVPVGVYRYEISETKSGINGVTDDDSVYYIDVFVTRDEDNNKQIEAVQVRKSTNLKDKVDLVFNNKLESNQITVSKTVTGNQANLDDTFNFTFSLDTEGKAFRYSTDGGTKWTTVEAGKTGTVPLKNNQSFVIDGLAATDTIDVSESELESNTVKDYVSTYSINGGTSQSGNAADNVAGDQNTIAFTNTKDQQIPTGLIENIAPFVLAIAAAGIVFFVYFKRDKEEELA